MEYFYDHQTDKLSITVADFAMYAESQELVPGVMLHVDGRRRPVALEISTARQAISVAGLVSFEQKAISSHDLAQRMAATEIGRRAWRALNCLYLVRVS